jgi:hypothetical protein
MNSWSIMNRLADQRAHENSNLQELHHGDQPVALRNVQKEWWSLPQLWRSSTRDSKMQRPPLLRTVSSPVALWHGLIVVYEAKSTRLTL